MSQPDPDYTRSLYPFLYEEESSQEPRLEPLLLEVQRSTVQKCRDVVLLRRQILREYRDRLIEAAEDMADRFAAGHKLLAFGNGGSATDAQDAAGDCMAPPVPGWRALPALALTNDTAVITAVANDVGFENIFLRQVIALGEPGDTALGFSTSGNSPNVLAGLAEAKDRGLLTLALAGNEGGAMSRSPAVDYCFVARAEHIPRIQEGQATIWHSLLELVQESLIVRRIGEPAG